MTIPKMVRAGGWFLIAFTLIYLGLQLTFILAYDYHAGLSGPDIDSFKLLLAGGTPMQLMLSLFAMVPLLLIPASIGAYYAFRDIDEPGLRTSVLFATLSAFALSLCLMRWPTFNWYLARFAAGGDTQPVVAAIFHGLDDYLGLFLGDIFSKVCASVWFFIVARAMLRSRAVPQWIGYLGIIAAVYLLITLINPFNLIPMFVVNFLNVLSPIVFLWLMMFGITLLMYKEPR